MPPPPTKRVINPGPGATSASSRVAPGASGSRANPLAGVSGSRATPAAGRASGARTRGFGQTQINVKLLLLVAGGIIGLVGLILAVVLFVRSRDRVQVPLVFKRFAEAAARRDAAGFIAQLDPEFNFHAKWPNVFPDEKGARNTAISYVNAAFQLSGPNGVTMEWTLDDYERQEDGTVEAHVSASLHGGMFGTLLPGAIEKHRFVLRKEEGWSFAYRVIDTDPFSMSLPDRKAVKAARSKK